MDLFQLVLLAVIHTAKAGGMTEAEAEAFFEKATDAAARLTPEALDDFQTNVEKVLNNIDDIVFRRLMADTEKRIKAEAEQSNG